MDNFQEYLKDRLIDVTKTKEINSWKNAWTYSIFISIIIVAVIIAELIYLILSKYIDSFNEGILKHMLYAVYYGLILGLVMAIIYLIITNITNIGWKDRKKTEVFNSLCNSFVGIYERFVHQYGLWDQKIKLTKVNDANNMLLTIDNQLIEWNIQEDVEINTRPIVNKKGIEVLEKYNIYTLKYNLKYHSKKLLESNENEIKTIKKQLDNENIEVLLDGVCQLNFSGKKALESSYANFYDFKGIDIQSKKTIYDGMIEKIKKDFSTIETLLKKFKPLDLN